MVSSPSPTDSEFVSARQFFEAQTTGQLFRRQHGSGALHLVSDGKALCGNPAWFICGPAALFADLLPKGLCENCLKVQVARQIPNRQLGLDFDGEEGRRAVR
jgi:hypothetical protein